MRFVDPQDIICPGEECLRLSPNGSALYTDIEHFSFEGGKVIAPHIMAEVERSIGERDKGRK
jgi:hypothetical protein